MLLDQGAAHNSRLFIHDWMPKLSRDASLSEVRAVIEVMEE